MKLKSPLFSLVAMIASPCISSAAPCTITEFDVGAAKSMPWRVTNDGVMGGLSKGEISYTDAGTMVFNGTLSLENNGGFSTTRSGDVSFDLGGSDGLAVRVKGDGRTYQLRLATDARYRSSREVSFSADIDTSKGEWAEIRIPFSEFRASWRGRSLPDVELDPSKIRRVGILLGDKKPGKFNVEIDWIRPYSAETLVDAVAGNDQQLIELAVDRGVPLYNSGDVAECADVYEQCIKNIAAECGSEGRLRTSLTNVLEKAAHTDDADAKA